MIVATVLFAGLAFLGLGVSEGVAQSPSNEDYLPSNVSFRLDGSTMVVTFDEPSALYDGAGGHEFAIRVKRAGTNDYITDSRGNSTRRITHNDKDQNDLTRMEHLWDNCNNSFQYCHPFDKGTTHTYEIAQVRRSEPSITVPTGTDADWVKVNHSIPFDRAPLDGLWVSVFSLAGVQDVQERSRSEGRTLQFRVVLNKIPTESVSVEVILDDTVGHADTSDFPFDPIRITFSTTQRDRYGGSIFFVRDDLVEMARETITFRLVNFNGIDPSTSVPITKNILDTDHTVVSYSVSPPEAATDGIDEQDSQITITASLTKPLDSFCHISWVANYAGDNVAALSGLGFNDFVNELSGLGTLDFDPGETMASKTLTIRDDNIPEFAESLTFTTSTMSCSRDYANSSFRGGDGTAIREAHQSISIKINASDNPVVTSVLAGDSNRLDSDRSATVEWDIGSADEASLLGYQVRWTEELANSEDNFYLTDTSIEWSTMDVESSSSRSATFPQVVLAGEPQSTVLTPVESPSRLEADTSYVVQVGARTSADADPIFSDVLSRVRTAPPISVSVSVTDDLVFEGQDFVVSAVLSAPLSEVVSIAVVLKGDSSPSSAEESDFESGEKDITFAIGEMTSDAVRFSTSVDSDSDDETLLLEVVGDDEVVLLSESVPLTISETLVVSGLEVGVPSSGGSAVDKDRAFSVSWDPVGVMGVSDYQVAWVRKPSDGSIPSDGEWTQEQVAGSSGVFPSGSLLFRDSNTIQMGAGLDADTTYLVRVRPVAMVGVNVDWSVPVEITTAESISVTYSVGSERVDEGSVASLTIRLNGALSEDIQVTWGISTEVSPEGSDLGLTAEEGDVTIVGSNTSTLSAGLTTLTKVYRTMFDEDEDDDIYSPFVTFNGEIAETNRVKVIITDTTTTIPTSNLPTSTPTSNPPTSTPTSNPPTSTPTSNSPTSSPSNNMVNPTSSSPSGGSRPTASPTGGGQPSNAGPASGGGGGVPPLVGGPTAADPAQSGAANFIDTVGTTHEDNIDRLAEGGITRGCNPPANTLFCPGRAVTRGEMATFMVRAFNLAESSSDLFADDNGNTHEVNINALATAEITRGCNPPENTRYCPDRPVTRAQMATFLARAMELAEGSADFDDTTASPHANDINRIASVGITRGCNPPTNSRYCPDRAVTRGEMATFLIRAEDLET